MADYVVRMTGQDNLSGTIKQVKSELNDLGKTTSKIDQIDKKFSKITNSTAPLKKQLRDLKALMAQMNMDGLANTEQYTRIAQEAGKIKDAMDDAAAATKRFSSDTRYLDAGIQSLQGIAAFGNIAAGTMGLLGVKSDEVQRAILGVQSAIAILNGVQQISNVLNKDSVLMQTLKALGLKQVEVATDEATAAQVKNNIAVSANPYVAAAVAIAALVGGLIYWASTMEDTTEEQERLNAAVDAFKEASDQQTQKLGEQLATFERLKKIYDESGGKVDILTKKILNNKEAQRILGVTLKTVDDVHRLFGKNSTNYVNASINRANALAAEQAEAILLGNTLKELNEIYAKLMKGEEVDWIDMEKILAKSFGSKKAKQMMQEAGGNQTWDWFYSNLEVEPDKVANFMMNLNRIVTTEFYKSGPGKVLSELFEKSLSTANLESINIQDLFSDNAGGSGSSSKGGSGGGGSTGGGDKYEKGSLADLKAQREAINKELQNGNLTLDQQIQKTKELVKLDRQIEDGEKKIAELKAQALRQIMQNMTVSELGLTKQLDGLGDQLSQFVKYWNDKLVFKPKVEPLTPEQVNKNVKAASQKLVNDLEEQKTKRETEALEKKKEMISAVGDSFAALGSIASSVGQMTDDKAINAAATIAQAIANYILGWTEATAKAAKLGPIGWAAFGLTSLAQVAAVVAQIHSLSGYASGGIISGGSSYGDQILARVNAGEMVLNRKQQSNLFRAIESGNIGAGQTVLVPEFKIKGSDLYGTLRNFSKSVGKTGKVTGIR